MRHRDAHQNISSTSSEEIIATVLQLKNKTHLFFHYSMNDYSYIFCPKGRASLLLSPARVLSGRQRSVFYLTPPNPEI